MQIRLQSSVHFLDPINCCNWIAGNMEHIGKLREEEEDVSDKEDLELSASTLAALREFYAEEEDKKCQDPGDPDQNLEPDPGAGGGNVDFQLGLHEIFKEDWQMSQFWYDQDTSTYLAKKILSAVDGAGPIACIPCPSVYHSLRALEIGVTDSVYLFEYDRRFRVYGDHFQFYDYNEPLNLPADLKHSFSGIICDPPFLSTKCLEKSTESIKYLMVPDAKIILCTGSVMEASAQQFLGLRVSDFIPKHKNNLGNDFACFTNFSLSSESVTTLT